MKFNFGFFNLSKSIGIDLGTANTLVYSKRHNKIILNEPSVVAVERDTKRILAVGTEAKNMLGRSPDSIVAIRPLSEGVIADYDITEAMIKYFIRKVFGKYTFARPEIMICVPIDVTGVEKRAVLEAALSAGAKKAYLIEEARAAALGADIDITVPEGSMIIDIGGGSTDVAIISLGGVVASRTIRTAGNNFDTDIIKYIKKNYNLLIGDKTAETIKIKLATALPLEVEEHLTVKGSDLITGLPKAITISSEDVRVAIEDSLHEIINCVKDVLEETPPELAADIIDKGVVMAGGGSLVRYFPELVSQHTSLEVKLAKDPLECVAKGTGMALDQLPYLRKIERAEK